MNFDVGDFVTDGEEVYKVLDNYWASEIIDYDDIQITLMICLTGTHHDEDEINQFWDNSNKYTFFDPISQIIQDMENVINGK